VSSIFEQIQFDRTDNSNEIVDILRTEIVNLSVGTKVLLVEIVANNFRINPIAVKVVGW
jgi:hypothetical protein